MSDKLTYAESLRRAAVPVFIGVLALIVHYSFRELMGAGKADILKMLYAPGQTVPVLLSVYAKSYFCCIVVSQALVLGSVAGVFFRQKNGGEKWGRIAFTALTGASLVWGVSAICTLLHDMTVLATKMAGG